jgi:hypothetical protein
MADNTNMNAFITVDDGSRRVPIKNTRGEDIGEFTFHPTDMGIIQRFNDMVNGFDKIIEPLEIISEVGDDEDITDTKYTDALHEAENRIYKAVDDLFGGEGAAQAFFGRMNPFSPVDGEFYCFNVLNAVGAYIDAAFNAETAKFSERAKKYMNKGKGRRGQHG